MNTGNVRLLKSLNVLSAGFLKKEYPQHNAFPDKGAGFASRCQVSWRRRLSPSPRASSFFYFKTNAITAAYELCQVISQPRATYTELIYIKRCRQHAKTNRVRWNASNTWPQGGNFHHSAAWIAALVHTCAPAETISRDAVLCKPLILKKQGNGKVFFYPVY